MCALILMWCSFLRVHLIIANGDVTYLILTMIDERNVMNHCQMSRKSTRRNTAALMLWLSNYESNYEHSTITTLISSKWILINNSIVWWTTRIPRFLYYNW